MLFEKVVGKSGFFPNIIALMRTSHSTGSYLFCIGASINEFIIGWQVIITAIVMILLDIYP